MPTSPYHLPHQLVVCWRLRETWRRSLKEERRERRWLNCRPVLFSPLPTVAQCRSARTLLPFPNLNFTFPEYQNTLCFTHDSDYRRFPFSWHNSSCQLAELIELGFALDLKLPSSSPPPFSLSSTFSARRRPPSGKHYRHSGRQLFAQAPVSLVIVFSLFCPLCARICFSQWMGGT